MIRFHSPLLAHPTDRSARGPHSLGVLAAALLLALASCNLADESETSTEQAVGPAGRFVLVGLDGANWAILQPLIESGRVPFLAKLIESGSSGILWSRHPTVTPTIWTTILTGRSRESHGIEGFTARDPKTGEVTPVRSTMRRVPALWHYLNHLGSTTGIIGAHVTWPAEPVDGFMISRLASQPGTPRATYPESLAARGGKENLPALEAILAKRGPKTPHINDFKYDIMRRFWIEDNAAFELGLKAVEELQPDFVFVYFHFTDIAQHNLWPAKIEPRSGVNLDWFAPVFEAYDYVDRRVAELVERIETPETAVMVVSDHGAHGSGMATLFQRHTDDLLEAMGYLRFRPGEDGGPETDVEESLVVPGPDSGPRVEFYLNARNPRLADSVQRGGVARRFLRKLRALHLDESQRPVFREVQRDPQDPDKIVALINVRVEDEDDTVTLGEKPIPIRDFYQAAEAGGGHTDRGILIAAGPPFRRQHSLLPKDPESVEVPPATGAMRVIDVAPTVLSAMGLPVPEEMEGRALEEIFAPAFAKGRDFRRRPVEIGWQPPPDEVPDSAEAALDAVTELLRAIGYVQ